MLNFHVPSFNSENKIIFAYAEKIQEKSLAHLNQGPEWAFFLNNFLSSIRPFIGMSENFILVCLFLNSCSK